MKKCVFFIVAAMAFLDVELALSAEDGLSYDYMSVTARALNIRVCPESTCEVVGSLKQGEIVQVEYDKGGWTKLVGDANSDSEGWVSSAFLSPHMPQGKGGRDKSDNPVYLLPPGTFVLFIGFVAVIAFFVRVWREGTKELNKARKLRGEVKDWHKYHKELRLRSVSEQDWDFLFTKGDELEGRLKQEVGRATSESTKEDWNSLLLNLKEELRTLEIAKLTSAGVTNTPKGASIEELAKLRNEGLISVREFEVFTERLRRTPGEKAKEIILAMQELHKQYQSGAMGEGNYNQSLWTLMDRLDRDMKRN